MLCTFKSITLTQYWRQRLARLVRYHSAPYQTCTETCWNCWQVIKLRMFNAITIGLIRGKRWNTVNCTSCLNTSGIGLSTCHAMICWSSCISTTRLVWYSALKLCSFSASSCSWTNSSMKPSWCVPLNSTSLFLMGTWIFWKTASIPLTHRMQALQCWFDIRHALLIESVKWRLRRLLVIVPRWSRVYS